MSARAYLDHNATTPLHPSVRQAIGAALDLYGNPSSVHAEGRAARAAIDRARTAVAALVHCAAEDVVFTSCGTEALNIALSPAVGPDARGCDHLIVGGGEHPAVLVGHRFGDRVDVVALDAQGALDLDALADTLERRRGCRVMLALQAANNETGVVQPVRAAADIVHAAGGYVVCDAIQAAGKIACDINALGADALAVSAHKFGGPKGVGALCFGHARHHISQGVVRGGGHERGLSAGTENIVGIVGLGAACSSAETRHLADSGRIAALRGLAEQAVLQMLPNAVIYGFGAARLPNTVCFSAAGYDAQVLIMNLDLAGVAVSAGSACASGKVKASSVLAAMGVGPDLAASALRVSLGWTTGPDDIDLFAGALAGALKKMTPRIAA